MDIVAKRYTFLPDNNNNQSMNQSINKTTNKSNESTNQTNNRYQVSRVFYPPESGIKNIFKYLMDQMDQNYLPLVFSQIVEQGPVVQTTFSLITY